MNHAFRNTNINGITPEKCTVTDEALLKRLYGCDPSLLSQVFPPLPAGSCKEVSVH